MKRFALLSAALLCFAVLSGSARAQSCANGQCSIVQRGVGYTYVSVPQYAAQPMACPAGGQCAAGACATGTCAAPQAVAYTHYHATYATAYRGGGCGNGNRAARRGGRRGLFGGLFHCGG